MSAGCIPSPFKSQDTDGSLSCYGFFRLLRRRSESVACCAKGHSVVNVDLERDEDAPLPNLTAIQGDLRDRGLMEQVFASTGLTASFIARPSLRMA